MSASYTPDDFAREEAQLDRIEHGRLHDIEQHMVIDVTELCVLHGRFVPNRADDGQCPTCYDIDVRITANERIAILDAEWDYRQQFERH